MSETYKKELEKEQEKINYIKNNDVFSKNFSKIEKNNKNNKKNNNNYKNIILLIIIILLTNIVFIKTLNKKEIKKDTNDYTIVVTPSPTPDNCEFIKKIKSEQPKQSLYEFVSKNSFLVKNDICTSTEKPTVSSTPNPTPTVCPTPIPTPTVEITKEPTASPTIAPTSTPEKYYYGYYESELRLLSVIAMAEAEDQGDYGIRLVIDTILNRVDSSKFPNTITDVIYEKDQFTCIYNGRIDKCYVKQDIWNLVIEEIQNRTNYDVMYFNTHGFVSYGTDLFKYKDHYFSGEK